MVAAVQSLRLCARACSRSPASRRTAAQFVHPTRPFSSTRAWRSDDTDAPSMTKREAPGGVRSTAAAQASGSRKRSDKVVLDLQEGMSEDDKAAFRNALSYADDYQTSFPDRWSDQASPAETDARAESLVNYVAGAHQLPKEEDVALDSIERAFSEFDAVVVETLRNNRANKHSFWAEDEDDPDFITNTIDDEDVADDDIMSMAHGKLEEHREFREYARIAAWQMPLLSKLARPFEAPTKEECLRFRYTTYMGENHPAQSKVVLEFSTKDLPLNGQQATKLKKLLGSRWNPETKIAKMSCEQFDHQAQNKRYLGDLVNKLIAEAKDATDTFEDVPLDTRHHKIVKKPKFPKEWYLTIDRVEQLENHRQNALLLDQAREDAGSLVDGAQVIDKHFHRPELIPVPAYGRAQRRNA